MTMKRRAVRAMCLCLALPLFLFAPFLAVEALAGVRVVRVAAPSGVDDTAAIQAALDACVAAGPGCVVQFGPGIYKTRQVFAIGFHGAIQGRGAKLTTIEALPGLTVTQAERFWDNPPSAAEPYPALISFWNSDVAAADMTLRVTAFQPTTGWWYGEFVTWLEALIALEGPQSGSSAFDRIVFQGGPGENAGMNLNNGPMVGDSVVATNHRIRNCRFAAAANGYEFATLSNARVVVGGAPWFANTFEQGSAGGLLIDLYDSTAEVSFNRIVSPATPGYAAINVYTMTPISGKQALVFLHDNMIDAAGDWIDGIDLVDYGSLDGLKTLQAMVWNNVLRHQGGEGTSGVLAFGMDGAVISGNRISGAPTDGINVLRSVSDLILANDLRGLQATHAAIWLQPTSSRCTVFGDPSTLVLDQGTDDTLIGVTPTTLTASASKAAPRTLQEKLDRLGKRVRR
mgnify:CR=1 FL=1